MSRHRLESLCHHLTAKWYLELPLVDNPLGFAFAPGMGMGSTRVYFGGHAQVIFDIVLNLLFQHLEGPANFIGEGGFIHFHFDFQGIHLAAAVHHYLIVSNNKAESYQSEHHSDTFPCIS